MRPYTDEPQLDPFGSEGKETTVRARRIDLAWGSGAPRLVSALFRGKPASVLPRVYGKPVRGACGTLDVGSARRLRDRVRAEGRSFLAWFNQGTGVVMMVRDGQGRGQILVARSAGALTATDAA